MLLADTENSRKLAILDAGSGDVKRTLVIPSDLPASLPYLGSETNLRWTADGQAITISLAQGDINNIWVQPLSGGRPHQLTHFPDSVIAYAWSPDGKRLAVTREATSRDVVLISNIH